MSRPLLVLVFVLTVVFAGAAAGIPRAADAQLQALAQKRLEFAEKGYGEALKMYRAEQVGHRVVVTWARRCLDSRRDLSEKKADHVAALEEYLGRIKTIEAAYEQLARANPDSIDLEGRWSIPYHRAEAAYWLAQAKAK